MRKLFAFNMVALDGFFEGPNGEIDWHNADNEEFNEFAIEQTGEVDTLLFGRKTYQLMASYWPTETAIKADPIVADLMNRLSKIVFSRTLESVEWNNTRLIRENSQNEIKELKAQQGKDIPKFRRVLTLAQESDRLAPTPQSKFFIGVAAARGERCTSENVRRVARGSARANDEVSQVIT